MNKTNREQDALNYHSRERPVKYKVVTTTPANSQRDLTMANSPGVVEPCPAIAEDVDNVYKYTARATLLW
jgi:malate dehydrogenase (oxaloacetate-decarboxylating)(NADP+)